MKCIIFENVDGSVSMRGGLGPCMLASFLPPDAVAPRLNLSVADANRLLAGATPSEIEAARDRALLYILEKLVPVQNPGAINPRIEDIAFPADRHFREAWKRGVGRIEVDMPKAREIHRNNLRALRTPKLMALDIEYQRADEVNDAGRKKLIAVQKQALRDVTADPRIEAAQTPGELKFVVPEVLGG